MANSLHRSITGSMLNLFPYFSSTDTWEEPVGYAGNVQSQWWLRLREKAQLFVGYG